MIRRVAAASTATLAVAAVLGVARAQSGLTSYSCSPGSPGPCSFEALETGFTQALYARTTPSTPSAPGAVPNILGGVAFASNGDVWAAECVFQGTILHRFSRSATMTVASTTLHAELTPVDLSQYAYAGGTGAGGCGLVNHPNGSLYANSAAGLWQLDANTGAVMAGPLAQPGDALGIAVDPQTQDLVYVGNDCHPDLRDATTCTLWDFNPTTGATLVWAQLPRTPGTYFYDGLYFSPSGQYLFAAHREEDVATDGSLVDVNSLDVFERPTALASPDAASLPNAGVLNGAGELTAGGQLVQLVPMASEPDGVAFHAQDGFVATLNESPDCADGSGNPVQWSPNTGSCPTGSTFVGGTLTEFTFPNAAYGQAPTTSFFATGGFRGDLLQVGPDGCLYGTQSPLVDAGGSVGVRYNDGTTTGENSLVQICGNFVPAPGVEQNGSLQGTVFVDTNGNGVQDTGEGGVGGVTVTITGSNNTTQTTTTTPNGSFTVGNLPPGTYNVSVPPQSGATVVTETAIVTAGQTTTAAPIGYVPQSAITGTVTTSSGQPIGGVTETLSGTTNMGQTDNSTATTGANGTFSFTVSPGRYTVTTPSSANGLSVTQPTSSSVQVLGGINAQAAFVYAAVTLACSAASGQVGAVYSSSLVASGGVAPYTFSIAAGSLPAGLRLNTATGAISGSPTVAGPFSFTASVVDATGRSITNAALTTCRVAIQPAPPPPPVTVIGAPASGQVGAPYISTLSAAGGVGGPYSYSVTSGLLPGGLTLSPSGVLSGTPTSEGTFPVTIEAVDTKGNSGTTSVTLTLTTCGSRLTPVAYNVHEGSSMAGEIVWFNSHLTKLAGTIPTSSFQLFITGGTIQFGPETLKVPDAVISFSPSATCAKTSFNAAFNRWETTMPLSSASQADEIFAAGLAYLLPSGFPQNVNSVTWQADITTTAPALEVTWQYGVSNWLTARNGSIFPALSPAPSFEPDYNGMLVNPAHNAPSCLGNAGDHAGAPEFSGRQNVMTGGGSGGGGSNWTGSWSSTPPGVLACVP